MKHKDIINNDTKNASPASQINPKTEPTEITLDDLIVQIESFFNRSNLDIKTNFKNGKVPLIREQFDMSQFYKSVNSIIEMSYNECIEDTISDPSDRDNVNILLRSIFKSIQSSNEILATMDCTKKIPH